VTNTHDGARCCSTQVHWHVQAGPGFTPLSRTDREGSVDERSDSAMLETRPSRPLIQDPSGIYGSGTYLYFGCFAPGPVPSPALPWPHCWQLFSSESRLHLCSAWLCMQPLYCELDPQMHKGICTASILQQRKAEQKLHFSAIITGAS
jgi:hypothetical protein